MLDKFKNIDNRIIRPLDGFEFILISDHLYISDYFNSIILKQKHS